MTALTAAARSGYRTVVTCTGLPANTSTVTLWRDVLGTPSPVRGWIDHPTAGALTFVASDNEVPVGRPVVYAVDVTDTTGVVTRTYAAPVTVAATRPLITEPVVGTTVELGAISQWPDVDHAGRSVAVQVHGRAGLVVMSDVMDAGTSSPVLRTDDAASRAVLRSMLAAGVVLVIRDPHPDVEDTWISVSKWSEARLTNINTDVRRHHTLEVVHTNGSDPGVPAIGSTLGDLAAKVPGKLSDIAARWSTLLQIAQADLS